MMMMKLAMMRMMMMKLAIKGDEGRMEKRTARREMQSICLGNPALDPQSAFSSRVGSPRRKEHRRHWREEVLLLKTAIKIKVAVYKSEKEDVCVVENVYMLLKM